MDRCVFCDIITGQLPRHLVYEDEHTIAFMDIQPTTPGHVVVVSKIHTEQVWDLDSAAYKHLMTTSAFVAKHIRDTLGSFRVAMLIEGLEVAHAHTNLIPLEFGIKQTLNEKKVGEPDHEALAVLAKKIFIEANTPAPGQ